MSAKLRGIRGAITVQADTMNDIVSATQRLLREIVARNGIDLDDIASVLFSLTPDLHAAFPALGAREMGWVHIPMLHFTEIDVAGGLGKCIRVLMHVTTSTAQQDIQHIYLDGAVLLRPDIIKTNAQ